MNSENHKSGSAIKLTYAMGIWQVERDGCLYFESEERCDAFIFGFNLAMENSVQLRVEQNETYEQFVQPNVNYLAKRRSLDEKSGQRFFRRVARQDAKFRVQTGSD